jgi:hypothetical protein
MSNSSLRFKLENTFLLLAMHNSITTTISTHSFMTSNKRAEAKQNATRHSSKKKPNIANKMKNITNKMTNKKPGDDKLNSQQELFHLILHKKWRRVRNLLQQSKQAYLLCQQRDTLNASCLAIAMGAAAPLDIIRLMVNIDQNMLSWSDEYNATALHLGCLNGAPVECIDYLLSFDHDLARTIDIDMRCPLHHAIEYAIFSGMPGSRCAMFRKSYLRQNHHTPYMDIIKRLCHVAPDMVHVQDADSKTPIDLIQQIKLKKSEQSSEYQRLDEIYQHLRYTSIQVYKENKRHWESHQAYLLSENHNIADCNS